MSSDNDLREEFLRASEARIGGIRAALAARNLDACYVRDLPTIQWASAFIDVFDEEPAHALFITPDRAVLHSDSRYASALEAAARDGIIEIASEPLTHVQWLVGQLKDALYSSPVRLAVEDTLTLREFRGLEEALQGHSVVPDLAVERDLVSGLRAVKDDLEIALMRKAQSITDAAFAAIVSFIEPGMSEVQVQRALDALMFEHGAQGLAFPTIVAAGAHGASPHAIPGDRVIEAGDAVVMDFGARYGGYCSDMTRTVFMGEPTEKMRRAWNAIRQANETCEAALRAGKTGAEIHRLAEDILAQRGFAKKMGHGLGHSLGISIHEDPSLSPRNTEPLPVGAVLTVEPGIYLPGEFGMRLEDFGLVTETGYEVITQSSHDMVIIERHHIE